MDLYFRRPNLQITTDLEKILGLAKGSIYGVEDDVANNGGFILKISDSLSASDRDRCTALMECMGFISGDESVPPKFKLLDLADDIDTMRRA